MLKKIMIARHHGFCMGVKRAINIAEETAANPNGPVTILNEIVHNEAVVKRFREEGVAQAFSVNDVDEGTLIISAHGAAPFVHARAREKGLKVIDATCPLVERIYNIILKVIDNGYHVIHFGDASHDETQGVVGHAPDHITVVGTVEELKSLPDWKDRKLGLTVQTTAHRDSYAEAENAAKEKWPHIKVFNTICDATNRRQTAVMDLAPSVDMFLVVGSETSANSKRLAQIADAICGRGVLIGSAADLQPQWFADSGGVESVGLSAGASTPEFLVNEVLEKLVEFSGGRAEVVVPERRKQARKQVK